MRMSRGISYHVALLAVVAAVLSACGAGGGVEEGCANEFYGGVPYSFGGIDGDNALARDTARDLIGGRRYDFTETNFVIADGTEAYSAGSSEMPFASGTGDIMVVGNTVTVELDIINTPIDRDLSDVTLTGTFDLDQALLAIDDAAVSFVVDWVLSWDEDGVFYDLDVLQSLTGSDWISG